MDQIGWGAEFLALARRHGEKNAVTDAAGPVSYARLFSHAAGVAGHLLQRGCAAGEAIATYLPNGRAAVWASYGITATGAAEASINPGLTREDVAHCLKTCAARLLITTRERKAKLQMLREEFPRLEILAVEDVPAAEPDSLASFSANGQLPGKIIFTSGTTGRPKGIVYTHSGRWLANMVLRANLPVSPVEKPEVLLLTPFSHGASLMTYAYLDGGASVTLLDGVDVERVSELLGSRRVDQIFAPPTVLAKLMTRLEGERIEGIRTIFCGTAPLSLELYKRVRATFGPVVRITYGKSETFNPITIMTPEETEDWYESGAASASVCVGWPASGVEIAIGQGPSSSGRSSNGEDDKNDGATDEFAPGTGPVFLRARHQLAGTMIDGVFTAHDGADFHRTGDVGFMDARGRLHLVGREADLIKTGGYRLSPEEVEAKLRTALPDTELVVVGLPSAYWGEVVTAVVADPEEEGWEDALRDVASTMTAYKRPRLFAAVEELPRNAMGKIVRRYVRDCILERYEMKDGKYPSLQRTSSSLIS